MYYSIRTIYKIPVAQPYRRSIPSHVEGVKNQIVKWDMGGVIVKSNSEYANPLVVVKRVQEKYDYVYTIGCLIIRQLRMYIQFQG